MPDGPPRLVVIPGQKRGPTRPRRRRETKRPPPWGVVGAVALGTVAAVAGAMFVVAAYEAFVGQPPVEAEMPRSGELVLTRDR